MRFAASEVGAGGCVFSELEGYFAVDYTLAVVPGTPAEEIVSVLRFAPADHGATIQFVFAGLSQLPNGFIQGPGGRIPLPDGNSLSPTAQWKPDFRPGVEYCASISSFGRNDLAAPALVSEPICATVAEIDTRQGGGGGCTVGGSPRSPGPAALLIVFGAAFALGRARKRRR